MFRCTASNSCLRYASLILLISVSCGPADDQTGNVVAAPVVLNIGFPYVAGEDPLRGIQQAARLISYEGLIGTNRDGRPQSRLAEAWTESADGLTWHFTLRKNAYFHDGTPVDSSAVRASLERSLATTDKEQYPGLADIVSVTSPTPHELEIHLRNRSRFLLDDLGVSIVKIDSNKRPVGTGPYVTLSSTASASTMVAYAKYYHGKPTIDQVVWKAYPAVRAAWAAMMRGEVDFLYEVGEEAREFIQAEGSTNTYPFLRNYVYTVALNHRRETFRDSRVRKAMNFAIDRETVIRRAFHGHGQQASVPAWPEHWAYDRTAPSYSYDPGRAMALLDAAISVAPKSNAKLPPARIRFTCLIPENFALWEKIGLLIQRDLAEVGVDMRLEVLPPREFNERIGAGNFDAVLLEMIVGNTASRPSTFWHSKSAQNAWAYRNPGTDFALDQLRYASDDTGYRAAYRDFQLQSLEDAPAIFIALAETTRAVSKRFEVVAPQGSDIVRTIADWRLAASEVRAGN